MSPTEILDELGHDDAADDACAEVVDRLVMGFDDEELRDALRGRLGDLRGARGSVVLRLVEAYADELLGIELAEALATQPDLAPDRSWEALMIVQGLGLLDAYPELAERLEEIDAIADEGETSLDELARQLEENDENRWIALQGLSGIEQPVRVEIIRGLAARRPMTQGVVALLRLLSKGPDAASRNVAAEALRAWEAEEALAPPETSLELIRRGGQLDDRMGTDLHQSLFSSLDSAGRGTIALVSQTAEGWRIAIFTCDVMKGIVGVTGRSADSWDEIQGAIELIRRDSRQLWTSGAGGVAAGLLAGSLMLGGGVEDAEVHDWLEKTLGRALEPRPFPAPDVENQEEEFDHAAAVEASRVVLEALPDWIDDSRIMEEFAEELLLRGERSPDPERNSGAYRFLFENRLLHRLELDRRMLIWMSIFWRADGRRPLSDAAVRLAEQLADEQNAVPGHPFVLELTTRSLRGAQDRLSERVRDPDGVGRTARGRRD